MAAKNITFNGQSLQNSYFLTKDIIYRNLPSRTIDIEPHSRRDGFRLIDSYYSEKTITVKGVLSRDTEANLKISLDSMKLLLGVQNGYLDIDDGGITIRYIATVASIDIPEEHYNITDLPYSITFTCQPFGQTTTSTVLTRTVTTPISSTYTINGSAPNTPIFKWVCNGAPTSPITQIAMLSLYAAYSSIITIPSLALDASGDYLEIDIENMTVKVSHDGGTATEIDYSGVFPYVGAGSNAYLLYIDCAGTLNLTETITYYPKYL